LLVNCFQIDVLIPNEVISGGLFKSHQGREVQVGWDDQANLVKLNIAETCVGTRALGPGVRSVVWVQGCPFRCQGCIAPEWIPFEPAREADPAELARALLADPDVTGLTFSGGEPMRQAAGLARLIMIARRQRDLTLICFTGYRLAELRSQPPGPGVADLLGQADVLIDGRYVAARDDGRGMRGSANQRVHFLTERLRLAEAELTAGQRRAEIRISGRSALLVGVPGPGVASAFDLAVTTAARAGRRPAQT
jgi:anaerobic ribonucleoside-triphosphate reductase activating protein